MRLNFATEIDTSDIEHSKEDTLDKLKAAVKNVTDHLFKLDPLYLQPLINSITKIDEIIFCFGKENIEAIILRALNLTGTKKK